MTEETTKAVAGLGEMTVSQLRARYLEVFGEPTASANRQWLLRRVAWRIQALDEGGLSERAQRRAAELARDADLRVRPPRLALVPGPARVGAPVRVKGKVGGVVGDRRLPPPGTVLRREHKGVEHTVTVLADGFEHEGKRYRSLSAVASRITGSHWNGLLFFGLNKERA